MAVLPTFDNTLGALFVGFSVSTVLYGIFLAQAYNYYRRYPSDKAGYKITVAALVLLETIHQIFIGHSVYYYSITNFLNILALLGKPLWSLAFQLLVGSVAGTIVKFFFTLRVWRFSYGNVWLTAFLLILVFGHLALAIVYTVESYELPALPDLVNLRVLGSVALALGVLTDMCIAISLCYYLQSMRSCYTQQSASIITYLTLYAVSTGILTSALSFTTLIVYNFMPKNFIFAGCYFVLSKLYAVSFVAALNTRQIIRGRGTEEGPQKSPTFQIVVDQQSHSLSLPLQTPSVKRDTLDVTAVPRREENSNPSRPSDDLAGRERPYYTVGW